MLESAANASPGAMLSMLNMTTSVVLVRAQMDRKSDAARSSAYGARRPSVAERETQMMERRTHDK